MPSTTPSPLDPALDREGPASPGALSDVAAVQDSQPEPLEESLVADARAGLTPAQMVERKLVALLKSNPLPVSHMMAGSRALRAR